MEVKKLDMDFEVTLGDDNKTVTASWDDFPSERGFLWYKLMYSTTNSAPVYPELGAVYVGTNRTDVETMFKLKYGKNHYIRLCVITEEENYQKGRYCSDVKKIELEVTHTEKPKQDLEKKHTQQKALLTERLKNRVDTMLEKFMDKLDSKDYDTDKKIATIERVITKLENLKEKNPRYERLVSYMIEKFESYLSELDD